LQRMIRQTERASAGGERLTVRIAIDYSARDSIVHAAKLMAGRDSCSRDDLARIISSPASGECAASPADAEVDLMIRTGGEKRLSDFMLWEAAYAELIFSDVLWPDFKPEHLRAALAEFHRRHRRFGGIDPCVHPTPIGKGRGDEDAIEAH